MDSTWSTRLSSMAGDLTTIESQMGMGDDRESSLARGVCGMDTTLDIEYYAIMITTLHMH